ncbi:MAG: F0F1 ATP synthase subunit B [Nitrospinae bacterium]|jgi:F-type H+-transporting ATPase subunit b|nr:F0F1 ATP synthase subunit B [Nitrospinota bacterium]MDA1109987.1 F0F1 ATP synthase subunit B [Nitrospinota bacterium]
MPQFEQVEVFSSLIFWSLLSFGLLFVLLKKYAFPPILDALDDREKKIRADIEGAEKLKQNATEVMEDLERELKNAHEKATTIVQMATGEAKKIQEKTLEETQAKVKQMQNDMEREIEASRNKLLGEIRSYTAALTIASTEKFLKKTMDAADRKKLAEESIEEVIREMQQGRMN